MPEPDVRPIASRDWPRIAVLEQAAYGPLGLSEGQAALETWGALSPQTCFVLGDPVRAYVLAMPLPYGICPQLGAPISTVSGNLHLHDLCVAPEHRRSGLGRTLLNHLISAAGGFSTISLVALAGTTPFWFAHGFRPTPVVPTGYGDDARYLFRSPV